MNSPSRSGDGGPKRSRDDWEPHEEHDDEHVNPPPAKRAIGGNETTPPLAPPPMSPAELSHIVASITTRSRKLMQISDIVRQYEIIQGAQRDLGWPGLVGIGFATVRYLPSVLDAIKNVMKSLINLGVSSSPTVAQILRSQKEHNTQVFQKLAARCTEWISHIDKHAPGSSAIAPMFTTINGLVQASLEDSTPYPSEDSLLPDLVGQRAYLTQISSIIRQYEANPNAPQDACWLGLVGMVMTVIKMIPKLIDNDAALIRLAADSHVESLIASSVGPLDKLRLALRDLLFEIDVNCDKWLLHTEGRSSALVPAFLSTVKLTMEDVIEYYVSHNRQIDLPHQLLVRLKARHGGIEPICQAVSQLITNGDMGFPYKRFRIPDIHALFNNLRHYVFMEDHEPFELKGLQSRDRTFFPITFDGQYTTIVSPPQDYDNVDIITDYFQEDARMRAHRKDQRQSPMEFWMDPMRNIELIRKVLNADEDLNGHNLREKLYKLVKECTQFKVSLARSVIAKLNGTRMLDFSAGWGDRLLGAMGAGVDQYVGVDPNVGLRPGHSEIIATLGDSDYDRFRVIYSPFQLADIPESIGQFDLVFTSPPYFDFEIYTNMPGQSVDDFPGYEDWVTRFLLVCLKKSWARLSDGGHLAIHITDTRDAPCCEIMNLFIQAILPRSFYRGVLASRGLADIARPIWVWKKLSPDDVEALSDTDKARAQQANNLGTKFYPRMWSRIEKDLRS